MSRLPARLIASLQQVNGFDEEAFKEVHNREEQVTSIRINPAKMSMVNSEWIVEDLFQHSAFSIHKKIFWSATGYYLSGRPSFTFDPLFHAGCYYVQEASSMFLEQALLQTVDINLPLKVLDISAAPGGKTTHLQSLLSPDSLLVSNDVIKSRAAILKQNIIKWGCTNVIVTSNDPQHFTKLTGFFDVIVTDAPCSGSGLFRKDPEAVNEWSEEAVLLCCGRQKRILSDILPTLKQDGILIYSTCSYSKEENEEIGDWLIKEQEMENISLSLKEEWGIVESRSEKSKAAGYRFYPDKVQGEGFYISCFRKKRETPLHKIKGDKPAKASAAEREVIGGWMNIKNNSLLKHYTSIFALPEHLVTDFAILKAALSIQYAGTWIGELVRDKVLPDHAFALSTLMSDKIPAAAVSYEQAIRYLQRADLSIDTEVKGWQLVNYRSKSLGWMNVLPNRINNYYPKDMRILKRLDE